MTTGRPASCCRLTAARCMRGQSLSNAFFWAINRSQDLTLLHDWYTKTGQGAGAEYRYIASPGSEGNFRAVLALAETGDVPDQRCHHDVMPADAATR